MKRRRKAFLDEGLTEYYTDLFSPMKHLVALMLVALLDKL